jgi:hypothetical protein
MHSQAERRAGENEAVEDINDSLDLFELFCDFPPFLFQELNVGRKYFHFDRLRRPSEVADQIGENSGEIPFGARYGDVELGTQIGDHVLRASVPVRLKLH